MTTKKSTKKPTKKQAQARAEELREEINYHSYRYHALDDPEIADVEYDALNKELLGIEDEFPDLVAGTPEYEAQAQKVLAEIAVEKQQVATVDVQYVEEIAGEPGCGGLPLRDPRVANVRLA